MPEVVRGPGVRDEHDSLGGRLPHQQVMQQRRLSEQKWAQGGTALLSLEAQAGQASGRRGPGG